MGVTAVWLVVASCGVPEDGQVGIGRGEDGTLRVFVRTCHHQMDGATLYWPDDPNGQNSNEEVFGEWEIGQQPDPLRISWPLLGPGGDEVRATRPLVQVPAAPKAMAILAGTNDNSWSARGPSGSFTAADLRALQPGQVLAGTRFSDADSSEPLNTVMTVAEFDAIDCSRFGS